MQKSNLPFKKHVFVCTHTRAEGACCDPRGGSEIRERLKAYVHENGLKGIVRISKSGCLDVCSRGANLFVLPDNVWYHGVTVEDLPELIREIMPPVPKRPSSTHLK